MNKAKKKQLFIIIVACIIVGTYVAYKIRARKNQTQYNIEKSIDKAGEYLQAQIQDDGQFIYLVHLDPKQKLKREYNILRHMGALYSLKMLEDYKPGSVNHEKVKKSIVYMLDKALAPAENDMLGMWSTAEIVGRWGMKRQVKLGAIGLTLVTLCQNYNLIQDKYSLTQLEKLGDFALFLQKENGGFYSKYYDDTGADDSWTSLYYPGEMAFGFVELYKLTKNQKYMDGAIKAMMFLYNERKDKSPARVEADHWALIASDKIFKYAPSLEADIKEKILDHAIKVVRKILLDRVINNNVKMLIGSFNPDGRPTPTATRVEGLVAIYPHINDAKLKELTHQAIDDAAAFLLRAQITSGKYDGAWPRSVVGLKGNSKRPKSHNRRAGEIRIDYVQHALSALIGAKQIAKP
jgi:hypothetical protein